MKYSLIILLSLFALAAAAQEDAIKPGDNLVVEGIPSIPTSLAKKVSLYTEFAPKFFASWHPSKREMLVSTRAGNSPQLHRLSEAMGKLELLTDFTDPVRTASYQPKRAEYVVYSKDTGGNEAGQLYRLDFASGKSTLLTNPLQRHSMGPWSHKGDRLLFTSVSLDKHGRSESVVTDLQMIDPLKPDNAKKIATLPGGGWGGFSWRHDDKKLLATLYISDSESQIWQIDVASGERSLLLPSGEGKASYGRAKWSRDGKGFYVTTDRGSEFRQLAYVDFATKNHRFLTKDIPWDVEDYRLSPDGRLIAVVTNEAGLSALRILDSASGKELPRLKVPTGVITTIRWHNNNTDLAIRCESSTAPSEIYSLDVKTGRVDRWTETVVAGLDNKTFAEPSLIEWKSFDGLTISGYYYRPTGSFTGPRPVIINIHGGPEAQHRPAFIGRWNYFIRELGVAMIYPNVRGSSGFGKTFLTSDNGFKREDSVKDIGALLDWIAKQPELDAKRVMVTGGSYGGYMSHAVATHYADRIAGSIASVGISNFLTFLERTESYRRDLRRVEYGDERDPQMKAFLEKISPLSNAHKITKPLFVVHGKNDPRVPYQEAVQIVAKARENKIPVWFLMANDEGHGFVKKHNADFLFYSQIKFAESVLLKP